MQLFGPSVVSILDLQRGGVTAQSEPEVVLPGGGGGGGVQQQGGGRQQPVPRFE